MEQGVYALPWDMTTSGHRQWSPFWVAQRTAQVCPVGLPFSPCSNPFDTAQRTPMSALESTDPTCIVACTICCWSGLLSH